MAEVELSVVLHGLRGGGDGFGRKGRAEPANRPQKILGLQRGEPLVDGGLRLGGDVRRGQTRLDQPGEGRSQGKAERIM